MPGLLTEDEVDDLLYFSRAGEIDELKLAIEKIDLTARRRAAGEAPAGDHVSNGTQTAHPNLTDILLFVSTQRENQNTPLHYASANGHLDIVDYLAARAELKALLLQNDAGNTPLHWAAFNGHLHVVKLLVDRIEAAARANDEHGASGVNDASTPSEEARADMTEAERDAADEIEAQKRSVWDVINKAGRGPTSEAQMNGKEAVVDYLLERIVAAPSSRNATAATSSDEQSNELPPDAQPEGERPAAAHARAEREATAANGTNDRDTGIDNLSEQAQRVQLGG